MDRRELLGLRKIRSFVLSSLIDCIRLLNAFSVPVHIFKLNSKIIFYLISDVLRGSIDKLDALGYLILLLYVVVLVIYWLMLAVLDRKIIGLFHVVIFAGECWFLIFNALLISSCIGEGRVSNSVVFYVNCILFEDTFEIGSGSSCLKKY